MLVEARAIDIGISAALVIEARNALDVTGKVSKTGDTMAGSLTLYAEATDDLEAVPLQQVRKVAQLSPYTYDAVGDGTTVDWTQWQSTEAAGEAVFVPQNATFNLSTNYPTKPVFGPGKFKRDGVTFGGFNLVYDAYRANTFYVPNDPIEEIGFPATAGQYSTVFSPGAKTATADYMVRTTIFGSANFQENDVDVDRVDGFGNAVFRRTKYAERCGGFGALALEHIGCQTFTDHNFWFDGGGEGIAIAPGTVGWDYQGLETRNPGIGAKILTASATPAAARTDASCLYAVGRDAFNLSIKGADSFAGGYRAGAFAFVLNRFNGIGTDVFRDGVLLVEPTGMGHRNGMKWQEGQRISLFGTYNFFDAVRGSYVVGVGYNNGAGSTDVNNSIIIGFNQLGGYSTLSNVFALGLNTLPLASGQLDTGRFGINILPANQVGIFNVRDTSNNWALLVDSSRRLIVGAGASVAHAGYSSYAQVHGLGASSSSIVAARYDAGAGGPAFILSKSRHATVGGFTVVNNGDVLGDILFAGADGTATVTGARIRVTCSGTPGTNDMPSRMQIGLSPDGSVTPSTMLDMTATAMGFFGATAIARPTYGAPTGTATRTTFDTTTVTTAQLAERVKALIDDLRSYGLAA